MQTDHELESETPAECPLFECTDRIGWIPEGAFIVMVDPCSDEAPRVGAQHAQFVLVDAVGHLPPGHRFWLWLGDPDDMPPIQPVTAAAREGLRQALRAVGAA